MSCCTRRSRAVQRAVERVHRWEARRLLHPRLAEPWRALLAGPRERLAAELVATTERMARLRSVSPFRRRARAARALGTVAARGKSAAT
jgi:hypothetical protein